MSSNPISDKELETLLRRAAAALEIENIGHFSGEVSDELTLLVEDCDMAYHPQQDMEKEIIAWKTNIHNGQDLFT